MDPRLSIPIRKGRLIDSTAIDSLAAGGTLPVIFQSPGLTPDVRLNVLGMDFHVHSVILKLYSNFFRRFLDSPDKAWANNSPSDSASFKYEYSAIVDEEVLPSKWVLEPGRKETPSDARLQEISIDRATEVLYFDKLMRAMYNRPYTIEDTANLYNLTSLADYYCALPIVSAMFTDKYTTFTIFHGKGARKSFEESLCQLAMAHKIRNVCLFKEAFAHVVSWWQPKQDQSALSLAPEVLQLVNNAYNNICQDIMTVQQALLKNDCWKTWKVNTEYGSTLPPETMIHTLLDDLLLPTQNAPFYLALNEAYIARQSSGDNNTPFFTNHAGSALKRLASSALVFDFLSKAGREDGRKYRQFFLCAKVEAEDLPWDPKEIDW